MSSRPWLGLGCHCLTSPEARPREGLVRVGPRKAKTTVSSPLHVSPTTPSSKPGNRGSRVLPWHWPHPAPTCPFVVSARTWDMKLPEHWCWEGTSALVHRIAQPGMGRCSSLPPLSPSYGVKWAPAVLLADGWGRCGAALSFEVPEWELQWLVG